jgi:hypothetical protein
MEDQIPGPTAQILSQSESGEPAHRNIAVNLVALLQEMYDAQQTLVLTLSDAERLTPGTFENWSAKDTIAHISAWIDVMNLRMDRFSRGEPQLVYAKVDEVNQEFYRVQHKLSWSAVLEASRKAYNGLVERIRELDETDLIDPERYDWLEGEPMWRRIMGTAYVHPLIHLTYYYNQRGQKTLGLEIQAQAAQKLLALDDSPDWHSQIIHSAQA